MSHSPLKLKAVIVDWAGTIVDHGSRAPVEAFREVFRRRGVDISVEEARGPMGLEKRDHILALLAMERVAAEWQAAHGATATDAEVSEMYEDFVPIQFDLLGRHDDIVPGALAALEACRSRGLKIGSSSGYATPLMNHLTNLARSRNLAVDAVVAATEVQGGRPAPWMIFRNMELLGVWPPAAVVVVDDTPVGVAAGINAGAWSIGVLETGNAFGLTPAELAALAPAERDQRRTAGEQAMAAAGAHYAINSIADLPPVLDEISQRLAHGDRP